MAAMVLKRSVLSMATITAGIIALIGVWMKRQLMPTHRYMPWHDTPQWRHSLQVYDKLATKYFHDGALDCQSKLVPTRYGQTQTHVCGSSDHPPVLFLHGAGSNSLIYGQWLLPNMTETHYTIAVDYPCDVGRSIPPQGDPSLCPKTQEEIVYWVSQVLEQLHVTSPVTLVGYSYGAFVSFLTALHQPKLVNKLVLLAPANIFGELSSGFLWHALRYALLRSEQSQNHMLKWMSANPNYELSQSPPEDLEQMTSIREVAATILTVPSVSFNDTILQQVAKEHPTFLGIGQKEMLMDNVTLAIERAQRAGLQVQVYPNAGHLMLIEAPGSITKDVIAFLND